MCGAYRFAACFQSGSEGTVLNDTSISESRSSDIHSSGQYNGFALAKRCNGSLLQSSGETCAIHAWDGPVFDFSFITYWRCTSKGVHDVHTTSGKICPTSNLCVTNCTDSRYQCLITNGQHEITDSVFAASIPVFGRYQGFSGKAVARNCFFASVPSVSYVTTQECTVLSAESLSRVFDDKCYFSRRTKPFTARIESFPPGVMIPMSLVIFVV